MQVLSLRGQPGGTLDTSLVFAEALQRRGQVQAIDGQAVHDVLLDDQPAQGLQGRHWGQHKQGAELAGPVGLSAGGGGDGSHSSPEAPKGGLGPRWWGFSATGVAASCPGLELAALAGAGARGPSAGKLFPLLGAGLGHGACGRASHTLPWLFASVISGGCQAAPQVSHLHCALFHPAPWPASTAGCLQ